MEPLTTYLLKMILCSAVLYGYYRAALYNERFHRWNRFYLLAALALSVVVPAIHIPVAAGTEEQDLTALIGSLPWNNRLATASQPTASWQDVAIPVALFVSLILFVRVVVSIARLVMAYHANPSSSLPDRVRLIVTNLSEAPFSFFSWLFWRKDIDPGSANGQRMLNHELTHIYEHHSIDKLFTSLLLCIFWINPFFWLMRNELNMIHEFLADRKAIRSQDGAAFAEMILQALPVGLTEHNSLVNPFFSSSIKRRLFMITSSNKSSYTYLRRMAGLVLMTGSVFALALSIQHAGAQDRAGSLSAAVAKDQQTAAPFIVKEKHGPAGTLPAVIEKTRVRQTEKAGKGKAVQKEGHLGIFLKPDAATAGDTLEEPLYILNGKEISGEALKNLEGSTIKSVSVVKGESAVARYGEKGKNGVVEMITRLQENPNMPAQEKVIVKKGFKNRPLYYVEGKEITAEEMNQIKPERIESVNVLKGAHATDKYGQKASEGAVEIVMKKPVT